jgi:hypothetical protein
MRRPSITAAVASAALTGLVVGGAAIAQTNDSAVITACVHKQTGNVRIVNGPSACTETESPTTWNQRGPEGPQGAAGPTGPQGPAGEQGPAGPASIRYGAGGTLLTEPGEYEATAGCDEDEVVIGGGAAITDEFSILDGFLRASYPINGGWAAAALVNQDPEGLAWLKVWALCAPGPA